MLREKRNAQRGSGWREQARSGAAVIFGGQPGARWSLRRRKAKSEGPARCRASFTAFGVIVPLRGVAWASHHLHGRCSERLSSGVSYKKIRVRV